MNDSAPVKLCCHVGGQRRVDDLRPRGLIDAKSADEPFKSLLVERMISLRQKNCRRKSIFARHFIAGKQLQDQCIRRQCVGQPVECEPAELLVIFRNPQMARQPVQQTDFFVQAA